MLDMGHGVTPPSIVSSLCFWEYQEFFRGFQGGTSVREEKSALKFGNNWRWGEGGTRPLPHIGRGINRKQFCKCEHMDDFCKEEVCQIGPYVPPSPQTKSKIGSKFIQRTCI